MQCISLYLFTGVHILFAYKKKFLPSCSSFQLCGVFWWKPACLKDRIKINVFMHVCCASCGTSTAVDSWYTSQTLKGLSRSLTFSLRSTKRKNVVRFVRQVHDGMFERVQKMDSETKRPNFANFAQSTTYYMSLA